MPERPTIRRLWPLRNNAPRHPKPLKRWQFAFAPGLWRKRHGFPVDVVANLLRRNNDTLDRAGRGRVGSAYKNDDGVTVWNV